MSRRKLRASLSTFTEKAFRTVSPGSTYKHNWHIDLICEYLEACTRGEITRLIINIPPRNMKSIAVNVAWPAWLLGNDPTRRVVSSSYSQMLSNQHSMDTRLVMQSEWYKDAFPNLDIAGDQNEKSKFITTARGHRMATSVGGSSTGMGGNFLIVDDPHNPVQALSDVQRNEALTWFDQTFMSRLDDKQLGVVVIIMQRLHEEDLTGYLVKKGGWEHVCVPAIAETSTVIDFGSVHVEREEGEALHPEREPLEVLDQLKVDLGSYAFSAQYQQSPSPAGGGIFKAEWFKRFERKQEHYSRIIQSWDTAFKPDQINDPSVCTTWGEKPNGFDLLHVYRARLEYPELKRNCVEMAGVWGADAVLIEDKASGQSLLQDLRRDTHLPLIAIKPEGDKLTRASTVSPLFEAGKVYLPVNAAWLADYEHELLLFPNAVHDDQVDSTSQFLNWAKKRETAPRIRTL